MGNMTFGEQLKPMALNSTDTSSPMSLAGIFGFATAFAGIGLLSWLPAHLICRYISSKPVGMQRLADLIYSDVTR